MHKRIITLLAGSILVAGCTAPYTEAPIATNFKTSEQQKLQSASHWQVIADDAAEQLMKQLELSLCTQNQSICTRTPGVGKSLYIKQSAEDTQFQKAFKQSLMNSLINSNQFRVAKTANDRNILVVEVDTEYVSWSNRAKRDPVMGEITTLTGGLWVLRNIYKHGSPGAAMMGAAVSADVYFAANSKYAKGPRPKHELVVSVTASDSEHYYANETNVYYTTEADFYNYNKKQEWPVINLPVKGN